MKIKVVSFLLNELQNNGVVRTAHKLDNRDMLVLARAAKGSVIRKFYFDEKNNGTVAHFIAANVKEKEFKVDVDERGRRYVAFDYKNDRIVRLPEGNGIIRITGIDKEGKIDYSNDYTKGVAGSEHLYCTKEFLEDTGEKIYIQISDQIRLYGGDDEMVEMLCVLDNDDTDIPEDIVWEIINYVLSVSLKVVGFPVDKTDDGNQNVKLINSKLASPQN
jgi:hypothetical protein